MPPHTYPRPTSNANHGHDNLLKQYAPKWDGSLLEAHADAFDPTASGGPSQSGIHYSSHPHLNDPTIINPPARAPYPSPPSSTGFPSPEQPRAATLHRPHVARPARASPPQSGNPSADNSENLRCCGRQYGSKYTFDRHRRESRTCRFGGGGREFHCYLCAPRPFGRRTTLKQHVQEVHRMSKDEAKKWVDTWYQRYGHENDYPGAMVGLEPTGRAW
ncbi:hypothetical protein SLS58_005674 [Diplodia intermedia]|uniref:C2H2-type domain-containing protein n=1 Tax=Diplodia intermedia TaxID=856260 RepID=A0ABR3TQC6_9PEZI